MAEADKTEPRWIAEGKTLRSSLGVDLDLRPWTSSSALYSITSLREAELLDSAWISHCHANGVSPDIEGKRQWLARQSTADVSQSIDLKTGSELMRTLTTASKIYLFSRDSVMTREDQLCMLGHNYRNLVDYSIADVKSLTGEAMALPNVGTALYSLLLGCTFPGLFQT